LSREDWLENRRQGFTYCAVVERLQIQSMAAVWKYSATAWEVAAVVTRPAVRRRGYGKAVVTFVTTCVLDAGRLATCSTTSDNIPMQRIAESVGFYPKRGEDACIWRCPLTPAREICLGRARSQERTCGRDQ